MQRPFNSELSDKDYEKLADLLDQHSPLDLDGLLGLMHAVAVAPGFVPPSQWLQLVILEGTPGFGGNVAQEFFGLAMQLYNRVVDALATARFIIPEADDPDACDSFAAGFIAGAELDSVWIGNDDHWTFASWAAYLSGIEELVAPSFLEEIKGEPNIRSILYKNIPGLVVAANQTFREIRLAEARAKANGGQPLKPASAAGRAGRNDPCPCGSGKKYKKCCIDGPTVTH